MYFLAYKAVYFVDYMQVVERAMYATHDQTTSYHTWRTPTMAANNKLWIDDLMMIYLYGTSPEKKVFRNHPDQNLSKQTVQDICLIILGFVFLVFHLNSVSISTGHPPPVRTRWVHRQAVELLFNTINFNSDNK